MTTTLLTPRPAATLILARDGADGPEIFLMQRTLTANFVAGAYVFPGGAVDPGDADPFWADNAARFRRSPSPAACSAWNRAGSAYWIAAIRETFEESGLLLATDADGAAPDADELTALRARVAAGGTRLQCAVPRAPAAAVADRAALLQPLDHAARPVAPLRHPFLPGRRAGRAGCACPDQVEDHRPCLGTPGGRARHAEARRDRPGVCDHTDAQGAVRLRQRRRDAGPCAGAGSGAGADAAHLHRQRRPAHGAAGRPRLCRGRQARPVRRRPGLVRDRARAARCSCRSGCGA